MAGMTEHELMLTGRTRVRRKAERGHQDFDTVAAVLDAGLVCHVGFALDGRPWVFPTAYARIDDRLYLHGAAGNFALRSLADGAEACVAVTILDGLVLARSAFHHAVNYRSVMLFGHGAAVVEEDEKLAASMAIVEHVVPGRTADTRQPTPEELRATLVVRFPIAEASAKIRSGGPDDDPADLDLPHWAGELPLCLTPGTPIPSDADAPPVPGYLSGWDRE